MRPGELSPSNDSFRPIADGFASSRDPQSLFCSREHFLKPRRVANADEVWIGFGVLDLRSGIHSFEIGLNHVERRLVIVERHRQHTCHIVAHAEIVRIEQKTAFDPFAGPILFPQNGKGVGAVGNGRAVRRLCGK